MRPFSTWAMSKQRPPQLWAGQPTLICRVEPVEARLVGYFLQEKRLISYSVEDMNRSW
jgi:hypothetical protein